MFGTMKDDSLSTNTLASNDVFLNGVNTFSKMANHSLLKVQNLECFEPDDFYSNFIGMWSKC